MKHVFSLLLFAAAALGAEPKFILKEKFDQKLSKDWFWGMGTWNAKNGVLTRINHGRKVWRKFGEF